LGRRKSSPIIWCRENVLAFFDQSDWLDYTSLRPISHVASNWELIRTDNGNPLYEEEENSLAAHLNVLIDQIAAVNPPTDYHAFENGLASSYDDAINGRYFLQGKLWHDRQTGQSIEKDTVGHMMEQASSGSDDAPGLVFAAAGRVATAMRHGVSHFDDLDRGHMEMLAIVLMTLLFRRSDSPAR
jgi:hypothetical protein